MASISTEQRRLGTPLAFSKPAQAWVGRAHLEAAITALENAKLEDVRGYTLISKEPIGVCALISPWNWPMNQLVVEVAPALAAGCTTVTKLSEYSPLSSIRFAELVHEAESPASVYNHITGFRETAGEGALASPRRRDGVLHRLDLCWRRGRARRPQDSSWVYPHRLYGRP